MDLGESRNVLLEGAGARMHVLQLVLLHLLHDVVRLRPVGALPEAPQQVAQQRQRGHKEEHDPKERQAQ